MKYVFFTPLPEQSKQACISKSQIHPIRCFCLKRAHLYNLSAFYSRKQNRYKDIKEKIKQKQNKTKNRKKGKKKKQKMEKHIYNYIEIHDIGMLYK